MPRFFIPADRFRGGRLILEGDDAHHAARVLRLRAGDRFTAIGPDGAEYLIQVDHSDAAVPRVEGLVLELRQPDREPRLRVTVAQALIKGEKFDWVVQKATELGAHAIWPFASARSVVRLTPPKARERAARWQRVAVAAAKQCGRLHRPEVGPVLAFEQLVREVGRWGSDHGPGSVIFAWEGETERGLFDLLAQHFGVPAGRGPAAEGKDTSASRHVLLIVGPEGGFDPSEARSVIEAGGVPVTLGPLILRTETAAPAVLAMMLYHVGDLGRGLGAHPEGA